MNIFHDFLKKKKNGSKITVWAKNNIRMSLHPGFTFLIITSFDLLIKNFMKKSNIRVIMRTMTFFFLHYFEFNVLFLYFAI